MSTTTEILTSAGIGLDQLSDGQRDILTDLSPEEASVLASVKSRMDEGAADDVEGSTVVGAGIF
jgi:hypothetical protein